VKDEQRQRFRERLDGAGERMRSWGEPRGPVELMLPACCPIPATHDRLKETHFFLHEMFWQIHHPDPFRWSLNAYLQAARSTLYVARKELRGVQALRPMLQALEHDDPLFRRVVESRNFVVHEKMLAQHSLTQTGIFRGRRFKLGFGDGDVPNNWYSEHLVRYLAHVWTGVFIDNHDSIGEQFGVKRSWIIGELGEGDVTLICAHAYGKLLGFVRSAHTLAGGEPPECVDEDHVHDPEALSVMLESDLDPDLPRTWGWISDEPPGK
jgi:hypothetical protein